MENLIRNFLQDHILFREYANQDFITSLVNAMKPRLYVDGAYIIRKGEIGRAMFFNLKGTVDVISDDGETIINYMEEGSFFGEIGVLYSVPRTVSCRSSGKSIMLILTKEALAKALEPYPKIAQSIARIAEERYSTHLKKKEIAIEDQFGEELQLSITQNELQNFSIFKDASVGFLHSLAMSLKPEKYYRNQIIFRKGDQAQEMYFVAKGTADAVDEARTTVFATLNPGSFFGEVAVFTDDQKRTATVICSSDELVVFKCEKTALNEILAEFPEVHSSIEIELARRMEYIHHRNRANLSPRQLQATEIEVVAQKLQYIPFFAGADPNFLHTLALQLKVDRYVPGTIIFREGEAASGLYFVIDGTVQIVSQNLKTVFAEVGKDAFFGEVGLFYDINRTATVRTKTEVTLILLSKEIMTSTLKEFPSLENSIREVATFHYNGYLKRLEQAKQQSIAPSVILKSEYTIYDKLQNVSLFKNCDREFLQSLATKMSIKMFGLNEVIFEKGDKSKEMYFLAEGAVNVVSLDLKTIYDTIPSGGFFGEVGVIKGTSRNATLVSSYKQTVCLVLSGDQIKSALEKFPDSYQAIILACDERISKAQARGSRLDIHSIAPLAVMDTSNFNIQPPKESKRVLGNVFTNAPKELTKKSASSDSSLEIFLDQRRSFSGELAIVDDPTMSMREGPIKSILDLDDRELSIVFYKVSFVTKARLRRVCKQWNRQLSASYFCKYVNLENHAGDISNRFIKSMVLFVGSSLEYLNISNCGRITDEAIKLISTTCENVRKFILSNCWKLSDFSLSYISQNMTNLEQLDISHGNKLVGMGFQNHKLTKLKRFNVSYCKAFSDKSLEKLFATTPEITEVRIRRCTRLTEFGIFLIVRFCRKLELLDCRDCESVSDRCLKWIATACFQLHSFNLSHCTKVSMTGFADFAQGFQSYKSLDLSNLPQVGDAVIFLFKGCIKELRFLCLRNCLRITDAIASHLAVHARKLRLLDVTGCPLVTPYLEIILKTMNKRVTVVRTKSMTERKVYPPGHPLTNKPKAMEIEPREIYTWGPRELMEFGIVGNDLKKPSVDINVRKFIKSQAKKKAAKVRKKSVDNISVSDESD